jgi:hypothetical protein
MKKHIPVPVVTLIQTTGIFFNCKDFPNYGEKESVSQLIPAMYLATPGHRSGFSESASKEAVFRIRIPMDPHWFCSAGADLDPRRGQKLPTKIEKKN